MWSADVVVVGGGAVGAAAAWQLARCGTEVVLLEQYGPGHRRGASHGTSRAFRPGGTWPTDEALRLWRELEAETGADLLHVTGGVDHGDPARTAAVADMLTEQGIAHEWLSAHEAAGRWPGMVFDGRVLHQPDRSGRLHAEHAVAALTAAAVGHGALVRHRARVTRVAVRGEHQVDVMTEQDVVRARRVVVAAGAWTAALVDGLVPLPPLDVVQERAASFPVLGALPCGVCPKGWPTFVHHATDGDTYGLPSPGEGVVVGAAALADLARLRDHVRRWLPGADAGRPNPIGWTATYTPEARFVLDRCGPVVVGTGSEAHGFTFAPTFGRALAELAVGARIPAAS